VGERKKNGHGLLLGKKMALPVPVGSVPCRVCVSRIIVIVQPNRKTCLRSKTSNFKLWRSFLFGLFFHIFILFYLFFFFFFFWALVFGAWAKPDEWNERNDEKEPKHSRRKDAQSFYMV
jgi:hypothetical protein